MIQSQRLLYKKMDERDFDVVAQILRDDGVRRIWEHDFSDDDVHAWIARREKGYRENGIDYLLTFEKSTRAVVGQIGLLKETIDSSEVWGIGYMLLSRYYGNGYATEGAAAMADYACNTLHAPRVVCDIRPGNLRSIAVAKRLGMRETGIFMKHYRAMEMPHLIFELRCEDRSIADAPTQPSPVSPH